MTLYMVSCMPSLKFDEVVNQLKAARSSIRCQQMARFLEQLGFEVRDAKKQGHKVFVHGSIESFSGSNYTCGHGRNPEIKSVYVSKVLKVLKQHEVEIKQFLGE